MHVSIVKNSFDTKLRLIELLVVSCDDRVVADSLAQLEFVVGAAWDHRVAVIRSLCSAGFNVSAKECILIEMAFVERRVDIRVLASNVRLRPGR